MFALSWCRAKYVDHFKSACTAYESPYHHHETSEKRVSLSITFQNLPFVYDSNVRFARQMKGWCNAASVAALAPGGHADISPVSKREPSVSRQQGSFLRDSQLQI